MLNFFYMYAFIWGGILLVYSFGWSNLCEPLAPELKVFFAVTIGLSLILGRLKRNSFRFQECKTIGKRNRGIVILIVLFCMLEFAYCGQIPLVHIVLSGGGYTEYTGIPTLHPLVISFASFYAQYLFYRFLCNHSERKALLDYAVILVFIYLLQFNRGGLMISMVMSGLLFLGKNSGRIKAHVNKKSIFFSICAAIIVLFVFGALGNIRHGYSFTDSSYIQRLGRFNEHYPSWMPKQFMWAYVYIITPVANINHNVLLHLGSVNTKGYIMTFIPDFVARRIYDGVIYTPELVVENVFNATAGFGTAYMNMKFFGMYFLYGYMMLGLSFLWRVDPIRREFKMPCLAIMNVIVIFMFFTHTLYYSAISFQIVFPLLSFFRFRVGKEA